MVNQVVLIGRLTQDLEIKSTTSGKEVLNFSVAVNRNFKNQSGQYDADFINCVAFGQTAKFMSQYLGKGRLVSVTGRIQTRNYENQSGQRVYVTEIICDNVSGLESRRDTNQGQSFNNTAPSAPVQNTKQDTNQGPASFMNQPVNAESSVIEDDDLPF